MALNLDAMKAKLDKLNGKATEETRTVSGAQMKGKATFALFQPQMEILLRKSSSIMV